MFPSVFSILPHLRSYGFFPLGGKSKHGVSLMQSCLQRWHKMLFLQIQWEKQHKCLSTKAFFGAHSPHILSDVAIPRANGACGLFCCFSSLSVHLFSFPFAWNKKYIQISTQWVFFYQHFCSSKKKKMQFKDMEFKMDWKYIILILQIFLYNL